MTSIRTSAPRVEEANDANGSQTPAELAVGLAVATSRLRARIRTESGGPGEGVTVSQVAMMRRLVERGPMSASELAASEHVSQQAIAQRLELLRPMDYLELSPDPDDHRRKLVSITQKGLDLLARLAASEEEWLARAISESVSPEELPALSSAIRLIDRVASCDLGNRGVLR